MLSFVSVTGWGQYAGWGGGSRETWGWEGVEGCLWLPGWKWGGEEHGWVRDTRDTQEGGSSPALGNLLESRAS